MRRRIAGLCAALAVTAGSLPGCSLSDAESEAVPGAEIDHFADIRILRYEVPGFDELAPHTKQLAYYLYEAGLSGRDIVWDQNYIHNLRVRRTLEAIVRHYAGDRDTEPFRRFMVYTKQVWFSNGIHHHASHQKLQPDFRWSDLASFARSSPGADFPVREGQTLDELLEELRPILFDPEVAAMKVDRAPGADRVATSAVNFYADVSEAEVNAFYDGRRRIGDPRPVLHGLNSRLQRGPDGHLFERVWKIDGMYGDSIERIVRWLELAIGVAENEHQSAALEQLVQFYRTGDLAAFDRYVIARMSDVESTVDLINGFIDTSHDPLGLRGAYASIVSFRDPEARARMADSAPATQGFENVLPLEDARERISLGRVAPTAVIVIAAAGTASPAGPGEIGLPHSDWILATYGSRPIRRTNIALALAAARETERRDESIEGTSASDSVRFTGFVNPRLVAVRSGGRIVDVRIEYPSSYEEQMLEYADAYSFLPTDNQR